MSNLVEGMLVGRVDLGGSFQACPTNYSAEDAMAVTIVRLYQEGDELRAEVAILQEQARILAKERDEARQAGGITFLMAEKRALENDLEVMTCKAAGWQNQAELNAKLLVDCREKAERYRLEANAMMAQRDEAQRKVAELQAGLDDIEEYGTEEIKAAVDLRHRLGAALRERDEARIQYRSTEALAMALVKTIEELKTEKAELFVQLVNLQAGSRRATLDEIAESVRDKYEPEYEREGMDND